jgi:hypothetical protein
MALTINISNTGQTTQPLSLFSTGASGVSDFVYSPNAITYQGVDTSLFVQSGYWVYVGNNVWNLTQAYGFQIDYINLQTNTIGTTTTISTGTGTNSQVASTIQAGLISQGFNVNVVVTLSYITPTILSVNYTIVNNDSNLYSFVDIQITDGFDDPSLVLNATNNLSYLAGNPNVTSQSNVPLNQVQESTNGYSYLIKSMYVVSTNPAQLIVPINYGTRDANGDIQYQILANTIDPRQNNSSAIRSNGMNNFIFDDSTVFQFDALAQTNVSVKYEFEQMGYDEIKKQAVGVELRKKFAKMEMESEEKADDFQNFYFFQ